MQTDNQDMWARSYASWIREARRQAERARSCLTIASQIAEGQGKWPAGMHLRTASKSIDTALRSVDDAQDYMDNH